MCINLFDDFNEYHFSFKIKIRRTRIPSVIELSLKDLLRDCREKVVDRTEY